ncbi:MAG TPA: hypothetical protein VHV83_19690 [Armatimonadota bacterium]|nr:hypothetical protein [Armatimonadota bacterium]
MKQIQFFCSLLGLLALSTASLWAYPSLLGPTGGANLPVASVVGQGKFNVAFDAQIVDKSTGDGNAYNTRVLLGLSKNVEVGANYVSQSVLDEYGNSYDDITNDTFGANFKLLLTNSNTANLAIGTVYQGNIDDDNFSSVEVYGVVSAVLGNGNNSSLPGIRGSVGVNWTQVNGYTYYTYYYPSGYTDSYAVEDSWSAIRPFASLDIAFPMSNGRAIRIMGEYQMKGSDLPEDIESKPLISLVLRIPFSDYFSAEIGTSNAYRGVTGGDKQNIFVGANLALGN